MEKFRPEQPKNTYDLGCGMHRIIFPYCTNIRYTVRLPGFHKRKESQNKEASSSPQRIVKFMGSMPGVPILCSNETRKDTSSIVIIRSIAPISQHKYIHTFFFQIQPLPCRKLAPQHPPQQPPSSLTSHHCFSPSNIQRCRWKA